PLRSEPGHDENGSQGKENPVKAASVPFGHIRQDRVRYQIRREHQNSHKCQSDNPSFIHTLTSLFIHYSLNTTVVLTEKAIAFCNDKTETWLDVAFANKTKPKYESTEQLVAKGLFPGAVALPEPSRAS